LGKIPEFFNTSIFKRNFQKTSPRRAKKMIFSLALSIENRKIASVPFDRKSCEEFFGIHGAGDGFGAYQFVLIPSS
jgi:hypothetical protein